MLLLTIMEKFELTILGCGSATPTLRHFPTAQILNIREKLFLIDCAEGTQLQLRKGGFKFGAINHIFISHLHGDHCLGLPGLISTFALSGRTHDIYIYAPVGAEALFRPMFDFFCGNIEFKIHIREFDTTETTEIYADRSLTVTAFPLVHRMPTCGFLFKETPLLPHIRKDMIDFLGIPHYAINGIKQGEGWTTSEGVFYPHEKLTKPSEPPRTFAYCSDTVPVFQNAALLDGVDLLFHEATFLEQDVARARQTLHSTALGAAKFAQAANAKQLVIGHFSARYTDEELLLAEARSIFENTLLADEFKIFKV